MRSSDAEGASDWDLKTTYGLGRKVIDGIGSGMSWSCSGRSPYDVRVVGSHRGEAREPKSSNPGNSPPSAELRQNLEWTSLSSSSTALTKEVTRSEPGRQSTAGQAGNPSPPDGIALGPTHQVVFDSLRFLSFRPSLSSPSTLLRSSPGSEQP